MVTAKVVGVDICSLWLLDAEGDNRHIRLKATQAYRWIQKRSMDSRKSIRHVAEAVLLSDEL